MFPSTPHPVKMQQQQQQQQAEEEDDFMSGLVEQMAHSMLDDEEAVVEEAERFSGPLHTTSFIEPTSWSSSSNTSPSPVMSPPTPLHNHFHLHQHDAWELLHLAAQEVLRLKMCGGGGSGGGRSGGGAASLPFHRSHQSTDDPIRAYRRTVLQRDARAKPLPPAFEQQQQYDWNPRCTAGGGNGVYKSSGGSGGSSNACQYRAVPPACQGLSRRNRSSNHQQQQQQLQLQSRQGRFSYPPPGSSSTVYRQQQPVNNSTSNTNNGSGMRALFLRGPGVGGTSSGTGVFLPQATCTSREQRRKPSCSTVLLPTRIVEVLNLNVDDLHPQPCAPTAAVGATVGGGAAVRTGATEIEDSYLSAHLSKSYSACSPTHWRHHNPRRTPEPAHLPTEWTY